MGQEELETLNAPVREGLRPSQPVAAKEARAIPIVSTPIPTAIPQPKLPLPLPSSSKSPAMSEKDAPAATKRDWNTSKLGLRIGVDAVSAASAGSLVAPIITMIDRGIMENASGRNSLGESVKQSVRELLLRPHRFIGSKPFALIFVRPLCCF